MTVISGTLAVGYLTIAALRAVHMSDEQRRKFHRSGVGLVAWAGLSLAHFFVQGH